jgi:hypothetical protein
MVQGSGPIRLSTKTDSFFYRGLNTKIQLILKSQIKRMVQLVYLHCHRVSSFLSFYYMLASLNSV